MAVPANLDPPVDPTRDHVRGADGARVSLVEYGDFECPYCGAAYAVLKQLERRLGGRLRLVFRHFPLTHVHPHAPAAAEAAEAAGEQGRFWEMHDRLFEHQRQLEHADLLRYAQEIGLDAERVAAALERRSGRERVEADVASGVRSGVEGTPALYIDGVRYDGFYDVESLEEAVEGRR